MTSRSSIHELKWIGSLGLNQRIFNNSAIIIPQQGKTATIEVGSDLITIGKHDIRLIVESAIIDLISFNTIALNRDHNKVFKGMK